MASEGPSITDGQITVEDCTFDGNQAIGGNRHLSD